MYYLSRQISGVISLDAAQPAFITRSEEWTWGCVRNFSSQLGQTLEKLGAGSGARVGVVLRTQPEHAACVVSLVVNGQCLVTLNAALPDARLSEEIEKLKLPVVIASAKDWERPGLASAARTAQTNRITLRHKASPELATDSAPIADLAPTPSGTAVLMLTSGTTGEPKRVPLTFDQLEIQLKRAARADPTRSDDDPPKLRPGVVLHHAPLVHISGLWGLLGGVLGGQTLYLMEKFNVPEWREAVLRFRPASSGGPPAVIRMIYDAKLPKEDLASLRALGTGTAGIDPDLVDAFLERYDLPVLGTYGATEFGGGVAGWSLPMFRKHWSAKRGAAGRMNPGCEARTVNPDTGEVLPVGVVGLLELRASVVGGGGAWVRTSDLARLDEDNFIWILGRADNAIIRGGFKIHPDQLVSILESHPAVLEASVVGLPDDRLGQVPVAALRPVPGAALPSDQELSDYVRKDMAPYCVPVAYKWVEDLPRTPSMKVSSPAVKALFF